MARSASRTKGIKERKKGKEETMGDPTEVIARISEIEERIAKRMRGEGTLGRLERFRDKEGLRPEEIKKLADAAEIANSLAESMKNVRALNKWGEKVA
ncbi:MAG: hypothetical protein ACLFUZ_01715 [Candidatus Micrarchaeia archaeon]